MTKRRFFIRRKTAIAGALVVVTLVGSATASAGPVTAGAVALTTAEICGPLTAATGPWGLACFAGGGLLSFGTLFFPFL